MNWCAETALMQWTMMMKMKPAPSPVTRKVSKRQSVSTIHNISFCAVLPNSPCIAANQWMFFISFTISFIENRNRMFVSCMMSEIFVFKKNNQKKKEALSTIKNGPLTDPHIWRGKTQCLQLCIGVGHFLKRTVWLKSFHCISILWASTRISFGNLC